MELTHRATVRCWSRVGRAPSHFNWVVKLVDSYKMAIRLLSKDTVRAMDSESVSVCWLLFYVHLYCTSVCVFMFFFSEWSC